MRFEEECIIKTIMQISKPENTLPNACALEFSNEKVPIWIVCVNTILDLQRYWIFPPLSQ